MLQALLTYFDITEIISDGESLFLMPSEAAYPETLAPGYSMSDF